MSKMDEPDLSPPVAAQRPLKCYRVDSDGCDAEDIEVIFARSSIEAKRRWSNKHWDGDEIAGISAVRQPQWDHHAPGPVPALEMIDAGWWFECHGCGTQIANDYIGTRDRQHFGSEEYALDREYGPDLTVPVMEPVELPHQRVWCCAQCRDDHLAERAKIKRWQERVLAWLDRRVLKRFPDAVLLANTPNDTFRRHCYVSRDRGIYTVKRAMVAFEFPGMKIGPANLRVDSEYRDSPSWRQKPRRAGYTCCNGDREAFEAYAAATKREVAA